MSASIFNPPHFLRHIGMPTLKEFTEKHPRLRTVCEFRARLAELTERNGRNAEAMVDALKDWCREAEATGIRTLAEFAARLKGYRLAGEH